MCALRERVQANRVALPNSFSLGRARNAMGLVLVVLEAVNLLTRRASHHSALLPPRLDRIAAAYAVRPVVGSIEGVSDVPDRRAGRLFARPPWVVARQDDNLFSARCAGRCRYWLRGGLFARPPAAPARRGRLFSVRSGSRCRGGLPNRMLARPPSAPTRRRGMLLSRGRIGLRCCWLPGWHDVGDRLCRLRSRRLGRHGRAGRLLRRETTVPGCRTNILILTLRPVSHSAARSHMHYLNGPASRHSGASGYGQRLAPISRRGLVVLEAGEDVVFVVHGRPILRGEAARWRRSEP